MEDVRSIAVHLDAVRIVFVVSVAADVAALVDEQHPLASGSQPLGADGAGEAGPDDQRVVLRRHGLPLSAAEAPKIGTSRRQS